MIGKEDRNELRKNRHMRLRRKVYGTSERPRLNVFRSSKQIYAQVIDDDSGRTLVSASSLDPEVRDQVNGYGGNIEGAAKVGELLAKRAKEAGITTVVFDRGGYKYHGRVAALAQSARKAGLDF